MKPLAAYVAAAVTLTIGLIPLLGADGSQSLSADVVLRNGPIYTVDPKKPQATAVAMMDGKFWYVGDDRGAAKFIGRNTRVIDLKGQAAFPGLADSHYHLSGVGFREMVLNLEDVESLQEFLSRVSARVKQTPPGDWVTGMGWIEKMWKPQRFPTRQDLDTVSPNNPVWLTRADGHGAVANSLALKIAKVDRNTPNPPGGEVMKDPSTGEPTGMILDNAQGLIERHVPQPTEAQEDEALVKGQQVALQYGLTQVQVAGGSWFDVDRLQRFGKMDRLKLRIYQAVHGPSPSATRLMQSGSIQGQFDNRLTVRGIKVMFDGALGSKGAALLEPYNDHNTSGFLVTDESSLRTLVNRALKAGIQVETHAIGDRANRKALDIYEEALKAVPPSERKVAEPRLRIEHAQVVHPDDIPRFAKLGVIPSMQPSHAIGDLHFAQSRLGMERLSRAYAWQHFLKAGSIIAGGSDAPVERGDPMIEFYAAVSRRDLKGFQGEGWHPEQAVDRLTALKMLTLWPAIAAFEEGNRGTIEVGKWADVTVLSADIMTIPSAQIPKTRATYTIVGGKVAFERTRQSQPQKR